MESEHPISCIKYDCGECCIQGWNIFVTEKDLKRWEGSHPEILKEVISGVYDNEVRKSLTKKQVQFADGKLHTICTFYSFNKKCLIHEVKPDVCKRFSCIGHPLFLLRFFQKILSLELNLTTKTDHK